MDANLFGERDSSPQLDSYKQSGIDKETVCQCKSPHCPRIHYLNEDGTAGPWETPTPTSVETNFRHSGWSVDRERVADALLRAGVPAQRLARFRACGASAYVEWCPELGRHRVRGFYCGDRFCKPCMRARSARGRRAILALAKGVRLRLATFTRRSKDESLTDALNHLLASFAKVRRSKVFKQHIKGGVGVVEIKRGRGSGEWHVHLHCLVFGKKIPWKPLCDAWLKATGDSFVVDLRAIRDEERGAHYVCKYLGKGFDSSVLACPDDLRECINALGGRRLLIPFGEWFGRFSDVAPEQDGEWRVVGGLHGIVAAAERGEEWARGILLSLRRARECGRLSEDENGPSCETPEPEDPHEGPS